MIIVNLKDGLGNQMFEYAFARSLQEERREPIVFNNFFFDGARRKSYSLNHFRLKDDIQILNPSEQKRATLFFIIRLFFCYPIVFLKWIFSKQRPMGDENFEKSSKKGLYVNFNPFHRFEIKHSKAKNVYIYGNYENYHFMKSVLNELKDEFTIVTPPSQENEKLLHEINVCEAVCVHIRRGDYLDPKWSFLNVCNENYYRKAMKKIEEKHPNAVFFIFSNTHEDLKWIQENYHFTQKIVRYVDLGNPDYEELRLMMNCKHFVISNSTFSWWAAVLSKEKNKTVIAPSVWAKNETPEETEGMYWPGWVKMDGE